MSALVNAPTRKFRTFVMDASRWGAFHPRPGDVIVATYPKCGTTWTQRIVSLLIHQSPEPRDIMGESPWIDSTLFGPVEPMVATLEAQRLRRSVKSHLPLDALPVFEGAKVIHTVRDGRDACISMHNHQLGMLPQFAMGALANAPPELLARGPRPPVPEAPREWFLGWMDAAERYPDGDDDLPFCEFEQTYWRRRKEPWLLFVHYNDLKADLVGEMRRISQFLEIDTPAPRLAALAEAASFAAMKRDGAVLLPKISEAFDKGSERFLNKGVNGRWKDFLTEGDLARYDALVKRKLSDAMRAWVERGTAVAGDPRALPD